MERKFKKLTNTFVAVDNKNNKYQMEEWTNFTEIHWHNGHDVENMGIKLG